MQITNIKVIVFRVPVKQPVRSAIGEYHNRPMVIVKLMDENGFTGWGEVFCNFPSCGAEHRARLIDTILAPILIGKKFENPSEINQLLTRRTEILTIKSGEIGPFFQCIAGIDIALWDLNARRQKIPLWKLINPDGNPELNVYASGLTPFEFEQVVEKRYKEGYRAFKLKVGFDLVTDVENIAKLRDIIGPDAKLMADANQIWSCDEALEAIKLFSIYSLFWMEEPIRANRPIEEWQSLSKNSPVHLAAGECLYGSDILLEMINSKALRFLQPDVIKWGGITKLIPVINACVDSGLQYCPHSFGGAIGLLASAHLLASCGAKGWLEVNANNNPLQSTLVEPFPTPKNGKITLPEKSGLGWEPNIEALEEYIVYESN